MLADEGLEKQHKGSGRGYIYVRPGEDDCCSNPRHRKYGCSRTMHGRQRGVASFKFTRAGWVPISPSSNKAWVLAQFQDIHVNRAEVADFKPEAIARTYNSSAETESPIKRQCVPAQSLVQRINQSNSLPSIINPTLNFPCIPPRLRPYSPSSST